MANLEIIKPYPPVLIAGFGDIGQRVARRMASTSPIHAVAALIRKPEGDSAALAAGVTPIRGDLADSASLAAFAAWDNPPDQPDAVFHFAPPPSTGATDVHTENLLAALSGNPPKRLIYISTTGVYGDCGGGWIDETQPLNPQSDRAKRRVDAETRLQAWCLRHRVLLTILRAPGIYAEDRLPIERLRAATPAIIAEEDGYTNHIHADDLASACIAAMTQTQSGVFNIVDDSDLKMGDYFDLVADHVGLPRPPRVSRVAAETQISPAMLSFMRESRRIQNGRMKTVLGVKLRYPTVEIFLREQALSIKTGT